MPSENKMPTTAKVAGEFVKIFARAKPATIAPKAGNNKTPPPMLEEADSNPKTGAPRNASQKIGQ